jgi:peptide/nickel transport system substrate-binding protein
MLVTLAGLGGLVGCTRSGSDTTTEKVVLGNLVEPFEPPALDELKAAHNWEDQPVLDAMDLLRSEQQEQGPPPLTVEEALALKNDSPEANEKILATLGRLAPLDGTGVDYEATFVRHTTGDLKTTNPIMVSSVTEFEYAGLTGVGLFTFDKSFENFASAHSVESWQVSEDRMVDLVVMRDDLTWSDGRPITAHDVEFTFKTIMTDEVPVPAVRQGTTNLKYVKAYDDRTLAYFHKEPLATRIANMNFPILPKHVYEESILTDPSMAKSEHHRRFEDEPVIGGAYELVQRERGSELVFQRRDGWYMHDGQEVRMKPYFAEVRLKVIEDINPALLALKEGQIHEMQLQPEQWQFQTTGDDYYANNTKVTALEWTNFFICWNVKTPLFSDVRVRRALSHAVRYDELLNNILYGLYQPCLGTYHPTSWMFPEDAGIEPYQEDVERAKALLEEAGWTDTDGDGIRDKEIGGSRVPFRFTLLTYTHQVGIKVGTLMKQSLDRVGIDCVVKPTEFTVKTQMMQDHKFQAAFGGWGTGVDPDTSENIWKTDAGRNYGEYSNKRVDELFVLGRTTLERDKREAIYEEIHKILWEEQPYTWLYSRNAFYGFNKHLRGYNFSPRGPYDFSPGVESIYAAAAQ